MTLLECINRILRINAHIRGDTDEAASLTDLQHKAAIALAQVAIDSELADLVSDRVIPKERTASASLSLVAGTRVYTLPSNFTSFTNTPCFADVTNNRNIYEYPGGFDLIKQEYPDYTTLQGYPNWWYWEYGDTTLKQVAFFQIPDAAYSLTYDYDASVLVTYAGDNLPFHNNEESYAFTDMTARRFKYMFEDVDNKLDIVQVLEMDRTYKNAKKRLLRFIKGTEHTEVYGSCYE